MCRRHVGCGAVRELTLEAPLVFAGDGALLLQVVVGEGEGEGEGEGDGPRERSFGVYSVWSKRPAKTRSPGRRVGRVTPVGR